MRDQRVPMSAPGTQQAPNLLQAAMRLLGQLQQAQEPSAVTDAVLQQMADWPAVRAVRLVRFLPDSSLCFVFDRPQAAPTTLPADRLDPADLLIPITGDPGNLGELRVVLRAPNTPTVPDADLHDVLQVVGREIGLAWQRFDRRDQVTQMQRDRTRVAGERLEDERIFRAIFNSTFQFIGLLSPDGVLLEANRSALQFGGLTLEAVQGRNFWEAPWWATSPETQQQLNQAIARAAQGEFVRYEVDVQGVERVATIDFSLTPIFDEQGRVVLIVPEGRDISERKRMTELVRFNADLLLQLNDAVIAIDEEQRITYWNRVAEEIVGISAEEAIGLPLNAVYTLEWETPEQEAAALETLYRAHRWDGEVMMRRRDGSTLPVSVRVTLRRNADNEIIGMVALVRDITYRHEMQAGLLASQEVFRVSIENMLDSFGIYEAVRDADGKIIDFLTTYANRAACEEMGLPRSEIVGRRLCELMPASCGSGLFEKYVHVVESGEPLVYESFAFVDDALQGGAFNGYFDIRAVKLGDGFAVNWRNVTERKRSEMMLARQAEDLIRSNSDLEQFAYAASHDLQEPLRMVAGYVELLRRRYSDKLDANAQEFIDFMLEGVGRMQTLIRDLLTHSRLSRQQNTFGPVALADVLDQALASLQLRVNETNAQITYEPLPIVWGDAVQLVQVLQNLIANSLKFVKDNAPVIHISVTAMEDVWRIGVHDNGIGIEPRFAERIFYIFQRLHMREEYSGTGIGLAVCKTVIGRHGGRIWVESEYGQGATFYFTLPRQSVAEVLRE